MNPVHQFKGCDLFALNVFLSVAAHRSFRAAGRELDITASAVSHSIKTLEQRLAVRLLNRTTRSMSLTDAGERLAVKLRPSLSSLTQALQEVDEFQHTPSGTIRINSSEGAVRLVLRPCSRASCAPIRRSISTSSATGSSATSSPMASTRAFACSKPCRRT